MNVPERVLEILSEEWSRLPSFVKLAIVIVGLMEFLILSILKTEFIEFLRRHFPGSEGDLYLASAALVIPGAVFLASFLVSQIVSIKNIVSSKNKRLELAKQGPAKNAGTVPEGYIPIRQLSSSEFSSVHLVQEKATGNRFLLKRILKPEVLGDIKIPQKPGIAIPINKFQDGESRYELLRYYDGWTLAEIIELNQDNVGIEGCLLHEWTKHLLEILVPLHKSRLPIVHRDINPSNILVRSDDLKWVLLDLSCAVLAFPHSKQIPIGRFGYTSPEQLQGRAIPASDLYSVGMVIYNMNLCKEPPTVSARQNWGKEELRLRNVTPTTNLQAIFERLISINPYQRFSDASKALAGLESPQTIGGDYHSALWLPSKGRVVMGYLSWEYIQPDGTSLQRGF